MSELIVHINSAIDRQPGDTTHKFTTYFSSPLEVSLASKIGVKTAEIPYTCSQFKDSNNTFWVEQGYVDGSTGLTVIDCLGIQIDDANFFESIDDVVSALNAVATTASYSVSFSVVNNRVRVTNTHATKKLRVISGLSFETGTTGTIYLNGAEFVGQTQFFNQMQDKLGFTEDYRGQYLYTNQYTQARGITRLIRSNCFYLTADIVNTHQLTPSPFKNPNIIAKIPFTGNFGSIQSYFTDNPLMAKCNDTSIDEITFSVLDDDLEEVDLNGSPITFTLVIK